MLEQDDQAWRLPRSFPWPPVILIGAVVLLSAVVVGYQVTRPAPTGPKVLTDQAFIDNASRTCQASIVALRPQDTSRESTVSPEQIAEQSRQAADGLAVLAQQLRDIPIATEQRPFVEGWLEGWAVFIDSGRRYAEAIQSGQTSQIATANEIARSGDPAQRQADAFARGNGLKSCLLQSAIRKPRGAGSG